MISNEYSVLIKGDKEFKILPNVEFDSIPAGYTVTASAIIKTTDKKDIVAILQPGEVTTELKDAAKLDYNELTLSELKQLCLDGGLSFPKTAKKSKLIEILEG